jgi:S1-C subfamily serine protease
MKRRILLGAVSASIWLLGFALPSPDLQKKASHSVAAKDNLMTFGEVIDHANHGVCAIVRADNGLGFGVPIGSGFFVNDSGYFVTNAHVARAYLSLRDQGVAVGLSVPVFVPNSSRIGGAGVADITVVEIGDEADIALLRAENFRGTGRPGFLRLKFNSEIRPGDEVAITGFPLSHPHPITLTASVASAWENGTFVDDLSGAKYPGPYYFVDRAIFRGFSGSPVYLRATGDVVGIAERTQNAPVETTVGPSDSLKVPALGQVLTLDKLRGILTTHNVSYTTATP